MPHSTFQHFERARGQLPALRRAIALVWRAAPAWTAGWLVLLLVQGLLPIAVVYLTRWVVDSIVALLGVGASWQSIRPALIPASLMAGVLVLAELLRSLVGWVRTAQAELVRDHVSALVHGQSAAVDLGFYEMPEFHDHLHRARHEAAKRPLSLVEGLGGLLQNSVTLLAMAAVLLPFGWWLPVALLASTLPALYVVLAHGLRQHAWKTRRTADERRATYYEALLTAPDFAAELRLFDLAGPFRDGFQTLRRSLRKERVDLARRQGRAELLAGGFALVVTGAAMVWMIWRAAQGAVSLGDLALFYQAFNQGQRLMRTLLENVGRIYSNTLFLGDLFRFLALESSLVATPNPRTPPSRIVDGIRFEGVGFSYPGSSRPAIADLDLFLPAGRIGSVVGPNGAGKSTLVKLLCRFYDPDQGRILIDGTDLRDFEIEEARRLVSALFQHPVHYNASVTDNIAFGDVENRERVERVQRAAELASATDLIARLPHGYDTQLGRWFEDGVELSIGEWQRVALARTLFRDAPLVVLDEPTSAMDAWTEVGWIERLRASMVNRTALIVTHRFTTARRTDLIFVMREGRVVEQGSHEQLLAADGGYARSWREQTETPRP